MRIRVLLAILVVATLTIGAAAAEQDEKANEKEGRAATSVPPGIVDADTARQLVAAGVKVVDVRTPAEFAAGHVPGAVNIPYDQMELRYAELGPTSTSLLLYCRTGHRSGIAIQTLRTHGFAQLYDLRSYDLWVRSEPSQEQH